MKVRGERVTADMDLLKVLGLEGEYTAHMSSIIPDKYRDAYLKDMRVGGEMDTEETSLASILSVDPEGGCVVSRNTFGEIVESIREGSLSGVDRKRLRVCE
ncbi:MAG: uncharacterized protein A8A55_0393 [Amphiamblys sp. WSBS2006]|nr:MAG: uncharacterized protein A8A55_0393 [Amphiamblys sp. WSBS2006]